jgi:O-antigen/teichoic acid export membrane protein
LEIGVKVLRGASIAAAIKLLGALLTYLMLVSVARVTSSEDFGYFATMFSLATLLANIGLVGQQNAILRFWPEWVGKDKEATAKIYLAKSVFVVVVSILTVAVAAVILTLIFGAEWRVMAMTISFMAIAIGGAEFLLNALRAKGLLLSALLPRDILWRAGVIAATLILLQQNIQISSVEAGLLTAAILLLFILPQALVIFRTLYPKSGGALSGEQVSEFWSVSTGLWGVTTFAQALSHAVTLIIMVILGPEAAGMFFAAQRTALLISVALSGLNQVIAPKLSNAIHSGRTDEVRSLMKVTSLVGVAGALFSIFVFILLGQYLLGIFDPAYASKEALIILLLLSVGQFFNAAAGPCGWLLQMGGRQHAYLRILFVSNLFGLPLLALLTYYAGMYGSALAITTTTIIWNLLAVLEGRKALGIDSSILGPILISTSGRVRK